MAFSTHILEEKEKKRLEDREKLRVETLQLCIYKLQEYFAPLKIKSLYLTGSILVPYKFTSLSDIDIAVEGLPEEKYFSTIFELEELLSVKIEIIELENCRFAEDIRKKGLKII